MKRKYSISLGIGAIGSAAYLALLGWYVMNLLQGTQNGIPMSVDELPLNLIFHVCLAVVGAVFIWTAFFSKIFTVAVAACICYTVSAVIFYHYLLFCAPLIVLTMIGSIFCYKLQEQKEEKVAEIKTQKSTVQEKKRPQNEGTQMKRSQPQRNTRQEMLTRRMQHNNMQSMQENKGMMAQSYIQPFQQPLYPQMQDPYAPLTQGTVMQPVMQPIMQQPYQNALYPYPVYTGDAASMQTAYQPMPVMANNFQQGTMQPLQAALPQPNQLTVVPQNMLLADRNQPAMQPQPHAGHTRPEGYFDDYGNFHPGNEQ